MIVGMSARRIKANFPINIFKKFSQSLTQAHAESTLQINVEFVWPLFCRKRIVQDLLGNFVSGFSKLIWFEILNSFSFRSIPSFVQYVFLPTEQAEAYLKICVLISTYIFPGLFGWKENMILVESLIFIL